MRLRGDNNLFGDRARWAGSNRPRPICAPAIPAAQAQPEPAEELDGILDYARGILTDLEKLDGVRGCSDEADRILAAMELIRPRIHQLTQKIRAWTSTCTEQAKG